MDEELFIEIYGRLKKGESVALAILTEDIGSSPRKHGSSMAVFSNGETLGSVGGGKVELAIINKAKEAIEKGESTSFQYSLNESDLGMQCGGSVKGYIKVFMPKKRLIIVGGGHIGEKLNSIAKILNFYTVVFDDREEYKNDERLKEADEIITGNIEESLGCYNINKEDYVVIVTRGHQTDKEALKSVVTRDAAYIGMIGSVKKIKHIMNELIDEGIPEKRLKEVYAPTGLDIASSLPEEIALGILSEIILIKNKGSLNHKNDTKKIWD
ncbi:XdhC/CoxI family protein [Clostridium sp. CTA-7]